MYSQTAPGRPSTEWPKLDYDPTGVPLVSPGTQWTSAPNHRLCDLGQRSVHEWEGPFFCKSCIVGFSM